jgi:hypothetical protein
MPNIIITDDVQNARINLISTRLDADTAAGLARVYTGTPPPTKGGAITTTLLATLTLSKPAGSITANTLTFNAVANGAAVATGVVGFVRLVDGAGNFVIDLVAGDDASNMPAKFGTLSLVVDAIVKCTLSTITDSVS